MHTQLPFVSIIIPVYGEAPCLLDTLTSLDTQSYPKDHYEVIVVDNGASFAIDHLVRELSNAVLVRELNGGSYCARNAGLKRARGEVVAFTDADCIPDVKWIESGVDALSRSPEIGLVAGRIEVVFRDAARPVASEVYDSLVSFPQQLTIERYHYGATANLFTTLKVFEKVGKFDPGRFSGGDCNWGRRVHEHGFRQEYCAFALVRHPARKELKSLILKSLRVTIGSRECLANADGGGGYNDTWYYHVIRRPRNLWKQMSVRHADLGRGVRVTVVGLYYAIKLLQLAERARVSLIGGEPRR